MKKKFIKGLLASAMICSSLVLGGCSSTDDQVIIYSNADDEAVTAMKNALDNNGFEARIHLSNFWNIRIRWKTHR